MRALLNVFAVIVGFMTGVVVSFVDSTFGLFGPAIEIGEIGSRRAGYEYSLLLGACGAVSSVLALRAAGWALGRVGRRRQAGDRGRGRAAP